MQELDAIDLAAVVGGEDAPARGTDEWCMKNAQQLPDTLKGAQQAFNAAKKATTPAEMQDLLSQSQQSYKDLRTFSEGMLNYCGVTPPN